ncbi:MAG: DNA translocase FtsK 4TM domain-containing protein, partial [Cyclobacteriaceae bacterium]
MAKNTYKQKKTRKRTKKKSKPIKINWAFYRDRRLHLAIGFFLLFGALYLGVAFVSYLFTGKADQSLIGTVGTSIAAIKEAGLEVKNWLGLYGALTSHYFIFRWFGLAAFLIPPLIFLIGAKVVFKKEWLPIYRTFLFSLFFVFWMGLLLGYLFLNYDIGWPFLSGGIGYELAVISHSLIGWGTFLLLFLALAIFAIYFFNITSIVGLPSLPSFSTSTANHNSDSSYSNEKSFEIKEDIPDPEVDVYTGRDEIAVEAQDAESDAWVVKDETSDEATEELTTDPSVPLDLDTLLDDVLNEAKGSDTDEPAFSVVQEEAKEKTMDQAENYDPTLDLAKYTYPRVDTLQEHSSGGAQVTKEELEQKKDKIIETLINFKIGISSIKATIGPTVTLYEIVPEAGVKISKIKNLEDDIALSLAALGIRIIAPIPGKGTIGIEVPNKNREMVSIKSVLSTDKFMQSEMELPVAWGRTISNEVYVSDLAKMPHLLMAGATGQGKSVGLNVLLTSLIYKKHPSQLKFVLVDPKKVELSLFNKLERHFLAMLPDGHEAIVTETKMVINTLNSLCIEMDARYDLMKDAGCRNLKEYNAKFVARRLNTNKGHRFMPYIVLVIDELSDLMMTAGKEVEQPIARLAQLARAIGIHLVVATQRPSVNVITGLIKANFPTRMSFRVTSKIDSRTILDTGGAEQLVGMGDMLLSQNSNIIRL